jgi:hypothetical protein
MVLLSGRSTLVYVTFKIFFFTRHSSAYNDISERICIYVIPFFSFAAYPQSQAHASPLPEFIDLVFAKTGSINSGKDLTLETKFKAHDWGIKSTVWHRVAHGYMC